MNEKELTTAERLENSIKHEPERYLETRNSDGELIEVIDQDSGRLWKRLPDGKHWAWID